MAFYDFAMAVAVGLAFYVVIRIVIKVIHTVAR
jgi:hypothetical protein